MKVLCVAEKNSIGKAVSGILGGGRTRTSNSGYKYVKNYEFSFDFPGFGVCEVVMTSVAGHLSGNDFPENYSWGSCVPGKLFDAPLIVTHSKDQDKIAKNIADLARTSDKLMIWTDCDREGEYIGWEILEVAKSKNKNMNFDNTWRAQFSHLERNHIIRAAKNPIELKKPSIDAVKTRIELDLRTGSAFTRFLTDTFKAKFQDLGLVSYGPCQFPTLGFVVDRYKRFKHFKPEEFWFLKITVKKSSVDKLKLNWKRGRLFDRLSTLIIFKKCMESDAGKIINVQSKPTSKYKPLPLTTVQLQKACSLYFKMSAKESLEAAEKLYQQGFISYPRTETDIFPAAMDLKELISKHTGDNRWGDYSKALLENDKFSQPRAGKNDDKAHPPIHPILYTDGSTLQKVNEKKVYEFIVRHFLACCSMDAKGQSNTIELKWGTELFSASGLLVFEKNFLDVYPYQKWESTNELPEFQIDEEIKIQTADMKSGKTAPPTLMTETELIALMDANGIGTDATIAEHIEKIISREYILKVTKNRKTCLVPTPLGMALVEGFEELNLKNSLTKPFLRKNTELELKAISDGLKTKNEVVEEMIFLYRDSFAMSVRHSNLITAAYDRFKREAEQNA